MQTALRAETLRLFNAALSREAHRIASHPELCWQQLYNRLQWESADVGQSLQREYQKRTGAGSPPWLRTRMRSRESRFLVRTLAGHSNGVNACVVSNDGLTVASASDDYSVIIWDLMTGEARLTLYGTRGPITACALSADGRRVVSADITGGICVWNLSTGELEFEMTAGGAAIYSCDLTPDDRLLATACADGVVRVWDLESHSVAAELFGHEKEVHDCKFAPAGEHLVSVGEDGLLRIWNFVTRAQVESLKPASSCSLRSCAVSPSGKLVAAVSDRAVITVWDFATGKTVCEARKEAGHHPFYWAAPGRAGVLGCAIDPSDKFAASPAYDRTLTVWEIDTAKELASLEGHSGWVKSCAMTSDGNFLVSAASDNMLLVWDLTSIQASGSSGRTPRYQAIKGCAFSSDGWRAASTCEDKSVTIWDVNQNTEARTLSGGHFNDFLACAIDPEGKVVVTTSTDNTLAVRELESGAAVANLIGHDLLEYPYFGVYSCAFSRRGRLLVSAGGDKTLKIWDTTDWRKRELEEQSETPLLNWGRKCRYVGSLEGHSDRVFGCAISSSGAEVVSAGFDGTVRIWDLASLAELAALRGHKGPVFCCAVSLDDRYILSGGGGGTISRDFKLRLWDLRTGRLAGVLAGHSAPVRGCGFSSDGTFCLSASEDGTLRLWNLASLENVATFFLPGKAYCVAFHPWRPIVGCGDQGGNFFLLDLAGVELGPIIVTAWETGTETMLRCPGCSRVFPLDQTWLGQVKTCAEEECGLRLRINAFVSQV